MYFIRSTSDLGAAVRSRRKQLGYTQAFLASYAGVSSSYLSDLENGKETIQLNKALEIISLLGMDLFIQPRDSGTE